MPSASCPCSPCSTTYRHGLNDTENILAMSAGLRRFLLEEFAMLPHRLWSTAASSRRPLDLYEETIHGEATKWWIVCYPRRLSLASFIILVSLLVSIVILEQRTEVGVPWKMSNFLKLAHSPSFSSTTACQAQKKGYKMLSVDSIPSGIMQTTSDLQSRSLWADPIVEAQQSIASRGLLAMPVGFKQRETVDKIIEKFPADNFTVMLFHYDGIVEAWNIFPWKSRVIQIAALNQTKWWFAKRFLHPDIIAPYKYIFIWDEDIGVKNFHASRYLDIVEKEGLEISQPALDPALSEVHHQITVRRPRGKAHRRMFKFRGSGLCFENSTQPPCTGWVEMMVPVFSRAAWRCAWYMIQNDLVHAWGLDMKLGYCSQGLLVMGEWTIVFDWAGAQGVGAQGIRMQLQVSLVWLETLDFLLLQDCHLSPGHAHQLWEDSKHLKQPQS